MLFKWLLFNLFSKLYNTSAEGCFLVQNLCKRLLFMKFQWNIVFRWFIYHKYVNTLLSNDKNNLQGSVFMCVQREWGTAFNSSSK